MNTNDIRTLLAGISTIMMDVDATKSKWEYSTGEVKDAYHLIYRDNLWKLQKKIGQLWYYVCEQPIIPIAETIAS
jgi:hypothetical protein